MDTNKLFLAFSYCNLFFKMSKNMKMIRGHITKKNPYPLPYHRDTGSYP
jgi:hypothetical protein